MTPWRPIATRSPADDDLILNPYQSRWDWAPGWDQKRLTLNLDNGAVLSAQRREPNGTFAQLVKIVRPDLMDVNPPKPRSPYNRHA